MKNDRGETAKTTTDGTDMRFQANGTKYYSHKFRNSALRYEVTIVIQSGDIVWTSGPYHAGTYPDITIFRIGGLKDKLLEAGERTEADAEYRGEPTTINLPDDGLVSMFARKREARARHETCNKCFKNWGCMNHPSGNFIDVVDYNNIIEMNNSSDVLIDLIDGQIDYIEDFFTFSIN